MLNKLQTGWHRSICSALFAAILLSNAMADPCGMVPPISVPRDQPGIKREGLQQTYVFYKEGIETLVIHPGFQGTVDTFGMLIPFPSPPSLRKVSDSTFEHIKNVIDPPRVTVDLRPQFFNGGFGMGGGMGMGGMGGYGGEASGDASMAIRREETRVLKEEAVGMYDVAVLQSGSSEALQKWMKQNGYRYPEGMDEVCEDYIRERWCFVAVRARVGHKQLVDPQPGQREVDVSLQPGASFDGHVQAMGFRFRVKQPVVPMRLSTYNEGELRNIVYVLADKPMRFSNLSSELVMRQVPGKKLIQNLKSPLPLLVLGGKDTDIPRVQRNMLRTQRDSSVVMQAAEALFRGDLRSAINDRLSNREEEIEKHLLAISERLGLRGEAIDRMHLAASIDEEAAESDAILKELESMTLTVLDGDFPRETLANENLELVAYKLPARLNSGKLYDAKLHGPPPADPPNSSVYTMSLSQIADEQRKDDVEFLCGVVDPDLTSQSSSQMYAKLPGVVWPGFIIIVGVVAVGFATRLRKGLFCGVALLAVPYSAIAQTDNGTQQFRYKQNKRSQPTRVLIDQLSDGAVASKAADKLIASNKASLRALANLVQSSESQVQRGWAIVCLAESSQVEADRYLRGLSKLDLPELERTWIQGAQIQRMASVEEVIAFFQECQSPDALTRPVEQKVLSLLAEDGKAGLEQILQLTTSNASLAETLAGYLSSATAEEFAEVGLTAESDTIRRQAIGYLASLGAKDSSVPATVIKKLHFDSRSESYPWSGGSLFLPALQWNQPDAEKLFLQLSLWMLRAEKQRDHATQRILYNNLRDLSWRIPGMQIHTDAQTCVMQIVERLSMKEFLTLAEEIDLEVPEEIRDYSKEGGEFEDVYLKNGAASGGLGGGSKIQSPLHLYQAFSSDIKDRGEDSVRLVRFEAGNLKVSRVEKDLVYAITDAQRMQKLASVDGKYTKLLLTINAPNDVQNYTRFSDYGHYPAAENYRGQASIPEGYWVYVYPTWYIWQNKH